MKYTLIDSEDAPFRPSGPLTKRTAMVHSMIAGLVPGKAAKVELETGETARGAKASITRAAKTLNKNVTVWDSDGVVYAQLAEEGGTRRRGRAAQ
jgi:hypothetical protein